MTILLNVLIVVVPAGTVYGLLKVQEKMTRGV